MKQSTLNTLISAHHFQRFKSCDIPEPQRSGIRHLVRAGYLKRTGTEYQVSKLGDPVKDGEMNDKDTKVTNSR